MNSRSDWGTREGSAVLGPEGGRDQRTSMNNKEVAVENMRTGWSSPMHQLCYGGGGGGDGDFYC